MPHIIVFLIRMRLSFGVASLAGRRCAAAPAASSSLLTFRAHPYRYSSKYLLL